MALVRLWLGTEVRRRWRAHVVLTVLIGVVGAVVLATGAGARTTASTYNRFLARQAIPDVEDTVLESLEEHHVVKWTLSELDGMDPEHERSCSPCPPWSRRRPGLPRDRRCRPTLRPYG